VQDVQLYTPLQFLSSSGGQEYFLLEMRFLFLLLLLVAVFGQSSKFLPAGFPMMVLKRNLFFLVVFL